MWTSAPPGLSDGKSETLKMIVHLIFLDLSSRGLWRIGRQLQLEAAILKSFILMSESFFMFLMTIHVKRAATFNPGSPLPLSDAHPMLRMQPQTGEHWSGAPESLAVPGAWCWKTGGPPHHLQSPTALS